MMSIKQYPRLFCIELIDIHKFEALENIKWENGVKISKSDNESVPELAKVAVNRLAARYLTEKPIQPKFVPCIHPVCEAEDGWHLSQTFVPVKDLHISKHTQFCPYLSRISNILKNGSVSNEMKIFLCDRGEKLLDDIENSALTSDVDITVSYQKLRGYFIEKFERGECYSLDAFKKAEDDVETMGLFKCQLKNHKALWLCSSHVDKMGAKVISDSLKVVEASTIGLNDPACLIVEDIENINMENFSHI